MDEQILFDSFHEALELEPRPGAYERMRFAMTNPPVALKKRSVFRMRYPRMGLRIAAGLTAAVIVIALIAAFLVSHHAPVGSVPANQDPNVKAYQVMIRSDYNTMAGSASNSCNTIQDAGCEAAIGRVIPTLQKWANDLSSFRTPSRFAVIDGQLRSHLTEVITELNATVASQKANDQSGFYFAINAALYERAWVDPATFAIEGTYPRVARTYRDAVDLARQSLDACVNSTPGPGDLGCHALWAGQACADAAIQTCEGDVQSAETQTQNFLIALLQNPAPSALTSKDARLQANLARADTALLVITDALLGGDSARADSGRSSYATAILAADTDVSAIGSA